MDSYPGTLTGETDPEIRGTWTDLGLRDLFAAHALPALIASKGCVHDLMHEDQQSRLREWIATEAYRIADALVLARRL